MKKLLFLLSLLLVSAISCGDGGKSSASPENGKNEGNNSEISDENGEASDIENTENTENDSNSNDGGKTGESENSENGDDGGETVSDADLNGGTNPAEEPDEENPSENAAKYCVIGCKKASDCVPAGFNAITDADNYNCDNGRCVYLGCLSDAECDEIYEAVTAATGRVYRCNKNGAYGYPECTPVCSEDADCDLYGQGSSTQYAYDFDNYKCESGLCVYTGCLSDAECETTTYSSDYKCLPQEYDGKTLKICTISCSTAADCSNSVYPEKFYECRNSQCVAKSCENDEWCAEYMTDDYVCK
ncbi:hypothetical protein J6Z19_03705 [bacterium]|nr:hypothetical protein [bacterium]